MWAKRDTQIAQPVDTGSLNRMAADTEGETCNLNTPTHFRLERSMTFVCLVWIRIIINTTCKHSNSQRDRILTVCGFIFPVIKANKSLSDMEMVQSAFLAAGQRYRSWAYFKKYGHRSQGFLFSGFMKQKKNCKQAFPLWLNINIITCHYRFALSYRTRERPDTVLRTPELSYPCHCEHSRSRSSHPQTTLPPVHLGHPWLWRQTLLRSFSQTASLPVQYRDFTYSKYYSISLHVG